MTFEKRNPIFSVLLSGAIEFVFRNVLVWHRSTKRTGKRYRTMKIQAFQSPILNTGMSDMIFLFLTEQFSKFSWNLNDLPFFIVKECDSCFCSGNLFS